MPMWMTAPVFPLKISRPPLRTLMPSSSVAAPASRLTLIEACPRLKVIGRAGVGVDNIDLEAARSHSITVVNSPTATTVAVAELTFGLLLALAREIPRADAAMKQGQWLKKELEGVELCRQDAGHHRLWPHRHGARQAGGRFRHERGGLRSFRPGSGDSSRGRRIASPCRICSHGRTSSRCICHTTCRPAI